MSFFTPSLDPSSLRLKAVMDYLIYFNIEVYIDYFNYCASFYINSVRYVIDSRYNEELRLKARTFIIKNGNLIFLSDNVVHDINDIIYSYKDDKLFALSTIYDCKDLSNLMGYINFDDFAQFFVTN